MVLAALARSVSRSLRLRVAGLALIGFAAVSVPAYFAFGAVVDSTVLRLGTLFAEKQILYDRYRGLETLMREASLARTLASAQAVREWAADEFDAEKRARGIAELEHYRRNAFADRSYFFVIDASGNYYFNDAEDSYAGEQYRYTIDPTSPGDHWYYATSAFGEGCHLNVDNDENLRVTKVWINCVVQNGGQVVGILGTGIDLTAFIREVVDVPQRGVEALFVDRTGAIQAHRNADLVAYRSLAGDVAEKTTLQAMFDGPGDRAALERLMEEVTGPDGLVRSAFMRIEGKRVLVGMGFLDRLGWYNVAIMDIDEIIDRELFVPIAALTALVALGIAALFAHIFSRSVLDRLARLETAARAVEAGDYAAAAEVRDPRPDEIGRLTRTFAAMAETVGHTTREIEARVSERTEELSRIAFKDALTGVANRRGLIAAFEARVPGTACGLMIVDIDHFKRVNDGHGHAAGDMVIAEAARRIGAALDAGDLCARWGGDEFMLIVAESAPNLLRAKAFRLLAALTSAPYDIAATEAIPIGASIGACLVEAEDGIDAAAELADTALYMAKSEGRGRAVVLDRGDAGREGVSRQSEHRFSGSEARPDAVPGPARA